MSQTRNTPGFQYFWDDSPCEPSSIMSSTGSVSVIWKDKTSHIYNIYIYIYHVHQTQKHPTGGKPYVEFSGFWIEIVLCQSRQMSGRSADRPQQRSEAGLCLRLRRCQNLRLRQCLWSRLRQWQLPPCTSNSRRATSLPHMEILILFTSFNDY